MPQPFPVREDDTERTQPNAGARNGFVGAFVRSVRRGQQTPAVGKVAIGALVVVLAAGSVVGLSVLLRGTAAKPTVTDAAQASPSGDGTTGPRSTASSAAATKSESGGKTVAGGVAVAGAPGVPGIAGAPGAVGALGSVPLTAATGGAARTSNTSTAGSSSTTSSPNRGGTTGTTAVRQQAAAKTLPAVLRGPTSIVGSASNRCIDVTDGASGARLQIYDCSPAGTNTHQTWTFYADETVRSKVNGQCMTVSGTWASGAAINVASCNGSASQKFALNSSQDLTNHNAAAATSKCVDVVGKATANGTKLQLWTCEGTSNQKWR